MPPVLVENFTVASMLPACVGASNRMLCLCVALATAGCTSGPGNISPRPSTASAPPAGTQSARSASLSPAFGDPDPEVENPPAASGAVVRPSAWAKLKGAIARPQAIPLPGGDESSVAEDGEQNPFPSADGRDF